MAERPIFFLTSKDRYRSITALGRWPSSNVANGWKADVTHGNEIEGMIQMIRVTVGGHQGSGCLSLVQRLAHW
jgi:hypothetical protein